MQISKKAWHYRLTRCYFDRLKQYGYQLNLCPYFWMVVTSVVVSVAIAFITAIGTSVIAYVLAVPVLLYTSIPVERGMEVLSFFVWAALLWCIARPLISGYYKDTWLTTRRKVPWPKSNKPKQPSLLAEWASAKHRKVCPRIDVTE